MRRIAVALAWTVSLVAAPVRAHPLAPALLDLRADDQGRVDVLWKTSTLVVPGAPTTVVLPASCPVTAVPVAGGGEEAVITRWTVDCGPAGLVGRTIAVDGLVAAGTEALVRIAFADGRVLQKVLRPAEPSFVVPDRPAPLGVLRDYARLGVEHILTGPDHLLFVLGLVLLVPAVRRLIRTVTAFTIGHSVTLALVVLDVVQVPSRPAELAIALTVLALASELGARSADPRSVMRRWPWAMAATFGLLHGLGFAGALREVGLPSGEIPLALFGFNLGIEIGQLLFVAAVVAGRRLLQRAVPFVPPWAHRAPAYTMGSLAAFWCFQRAAAFFS